MAAMSCSVATLTGCAAGSAPVLPATLSPTPAPPSVPPLLPTPIVDGIDVTGADAGPATLVSRAFGFGLGDALDAGKLERGRAAAALAYADLGYPEVAIRTEVVPLDGARVRVVVHVSEGAPARIADVAFVGASAAPADLARASGLVAGSVCSRDLVADAPRRLRFFLAERGHVDAAASVDPVTFVGREVHLVVRVSEGASHAVGRVRFEGLEAPPSGALRLREGATFRPTDARADADTLGALAPRGTTVSHRLTVDRRARRVDVTFTRALSDIY